MIGLCMAFYIIIIIRYSIKIIENVSKGKHLTKGSGYEDSFEDLVEIAFAL